MKHETMQHKLTVDVESAEVIYRPRIRLGICDRAWGRSRGYAAFLTPAQAAEIAADLIAEAQRIIGEIQAEIETEQA